MIDPRLRRHELGFLELVDRPSPEALAKYYAEAYYQNEASNYRKSYPPDELEVIAMRVSQRAARALEILGDGRRGSMLDIGCGEGFAMRHFDQLGWRVAGVDFSRSGVEAMNPGIADRVEQGDVFRLLDERIASGDGHDLVWLGNVLEHVLDPVGLLVSTRKLVRPDGLMVVTVPNDGSAFQEQLLESGAIPHRFWIAVPDHISYFGAESLRRTARHAGWDCAGMQADFPIDWFLAHPGSNYVVDRTKGPDAHRARIALERRIGLAGTDVANRLYESLAEAGFGRNITAYLRPALQGAEA